MAHDTKTIWERDNQAKLEEAGFTWMQDIKAGAYFNWHDKSKRIGVMLSDHQEQIKVDITCEDFTDDDNLPICGVDFQIDNKTQATVILDMVDCLVSHMIEGCPCKSNCEIIR